MEYPSNPRTHNLPAPLSTFIGRESEIAKVKQRLSEARLLTLTGPGGSGKTRLAIQAASDLVAEFADGVWLVEFAPLADPALVPQAVAAVLSVQEQAGRKHIDALTDHLLLRDTLLVLDNCEHLIDACSRLAETLLQACPCLRILATSRENLGIPGEAVWSVPPLSLPDPQPWSGPSSIENALSMYKKSEAVQLFAVRAAEAFPGFALTEQNGGWVANVCRRLDGMPLAIELAAARVQTLSVQQIAERLVDRFKLLTSASRTAPTRQQTLEATLDWSYALLSEAEQKILPRLSVFAGGWTLEAAEAVCAMDGIKASDVLDLLTQLANKSLVVVQRVPGQETRFRLLETVRQYAHEKLAGEKLGDGKAAQSRDYERMRDRHLAYFIEWVEDSRPGLTGQDQQIWLDRYEREHENIRSALERGLSGESRADQCLRLAVASTRFFYLHGYLSEGRSYLSAALNREQTAKETPLRAVGLTELAGLAFLQSDFPTVHRLQEESLSIWRALSLERSAEYAWTLKVQGDLMMEEGDYAASNALLMESLGIFRELNIVLGICDTLMLLGWAAMRAGDYPEAKARLEEFLGLARKTGFANHIAFALSGLGELAVRQAEYERARVLLEESLALRRGHGDKWGIGTALGSLGWAALRRGDYQQMRAALKESAAIRMETGDQGGIAWCLEKLAEGTFLEARAQPAKTRAERVQRAVRMYGAAAAIRASLGSVIDQADQPEYNQTIAGLRSQLGQADFEAAWSEGEKLIAQDQGFAEALELGLQETSADHANTAMPPDQKPIRNPGGLSRREREVAALIAQGKSNREIAVAMTVGVKTAETYVTRILNKLGLDSRVQIAVWAIENGMAPPAQSPQS